MLKAKSKSTDTSDMEATVEWVCPPFIQLDKHVRFYRDLMKSTEKVELTLSHSGKKEIFEDSESPSEPSKIASDTISRHEVILVPIRADLDPRRDLMDEEHGVRTRKEYTDPEALRQVLIMRAHNATPATSRGASPLTSPRHTQSQVPVATPGAPGTARPPPPPGGPPGSKPPPPPPPKKPRTEA